MNKKVMDPQPDYKLNNKCTNMNKFLVYTSNPDTMPKDMNDVIEFAKETPKFYISGAELNSTLQGVKAGDQVITKKGNVIYIIRAIEESMENLSAEDHNYLEDLKRNYGLRNMNITSVEQIVKFETWCKSAKPIINNNKTEVKMNSIKSVSARIKEMFMPTEAKGIRVSTNGDLAVETANGYVAIIGEDNELVSYPQELTIDLPVYVVSKAKEQLVEGDVIATERGYAKVTKIDGDKISAISYTGAGKTIHTIKDFLFNQTMVRVVVSLAGVTGGQMNPMMLLALSEDGKKDSLLPFLMMNQQGGTMGMNPMMMAMLLGDDKGGSSMKDILMMSALSGGNGFGGLFGQAPATQATAKVAATKKPRRAAAKKNAAAEAAE